MSEQVLERLVGPVEASEALRAGLCSAGRLAAEVQERIDQAELALERLSGGVCGWCETPGCDSVGCGPDSVRGEPGVYLGDAGAALAKAKADARAFVAGSGVFAGGEGFREVVARSLITALLDSIEAFERSGAEASAGGAVRDV